MDIFQLIEDFLSYAERNLELNSFDKIYARNRIYDDLGVYPSGDFSSPKKINDVNYFVKEFTKYYAKKNLDETSIQINLSRLFDMVSPRPSVVVDKFNYLYKKNPKLATDYLYKLGINNYYIHKADIDKNIEWTTNFKKGSNIEVSINLSKPEKNNKDIAKLLSKKEEMNYPKCVICLENLGFAGSNKKAPRHNIRLIPLKINSETWYMQYSPYGYFKEHMILIDSKHEYMEISPRIFSNLFAFVDQFPYYSIVSNSDLPIVGGSILNHEHFQGGNYRFPLQKAKDEFVIKSKKYKQTKISFLSFYNTAFKLVGKDKKEILKIASMFLEKWRTYTDKDVNIIAKSNDERHNTITPILSKNKNNEYEFIMILRNNNTSKEYPDGIYHVHPEYFAIKKEGIGVIEAMGRFILPARLVRQVKEVEDVVKHHYNKKEYLKKYPDLVIFENMINDLRKTHMSSKDYISEVGKNILLNTSVFKKDPTGYLHLHKFIKKLDL